MQGLVLKDLMTVCQLSETEDLDKPQTARPPSCIAIFTEAFGSNHLYLVSFFTRNRRLVVVFFSRSFICRALFLKLFTPFLLGASSGDSRPSARRLIQS